MKEWLNRRVLISAGLATLIVGALVAGLDWSAWQIVSWLVVLGGLYLSLTHKGGVSDQSAWLVLAPSLTFLVGVTLFRWGRETWQQIDVTAIFAFAAYAVIHREQPRYSTPPPARKSIADRSEQSTNHSLADNGAAFIALLSTDRPEGWQQAKRLTEHFQTVSATPGAKIILRSWAPRERGTHPRCLVGFAKAGAESATDPLCEIRPNGQLTISAAPIKRHAPIAFAAVVRAGVHPEASQRNYPATVSLVKALSAAAQE